MTMVRGVLRTKARLGLGSDVVSLEVSYWVVLMVQHLEHVGDVTEAVRIMRD